MYQKKIKNLRSFVTQKYFIFENFSFVVHFTLDQTGVLFWVTQYLNCLISYEKATNHTARQLLSFAKHMIILIIFGCIFHMNEERLLFYFRLDAVENK